MIKKFLVSVLTLIVITGISLIAYNYFRLQNTKVIEITSNAMAPSFPQGTFVRVKLGPFKGSGLQRTDIIVYTSADGNFEYVSRIIGIPGEHIQIKKGHIWTDERELGEPYLDPNNRAVIDCNDPSFCVKGKDVVIPTDSFYVASDNRKYPSGSMDFGPLPIERITGKVIAVIK